MVSNRVEVCRAGKTDPRAAACCPVCSVPGLPVRPVTVAALAVNGRLSGGREAAEGWHLCLSRGCGVVYFGPEILRKEDVKVRVWFKETEEPIPVCYCRDVTQGDVLEHIVVRRCCDSLRDIQEHTGANTGRECATRNPAGA